MSMLELLSASPSLFTGTVLVLGLMVGSFLNVVIYRVPVMLDRQWRRQCAELASKTPAIDEPPFNLVVPRSACPHCHAPITALQNVPVLSYLFLGGRCAHCRAPIGLRYPLIEVLTGALSAAVAWKYGYGWPTGAALVLTWFLIALAFIDIDHQLLPDDLTLPLLWIGLAASLWWSGAGPCPLADPRSSILGAVAGYLSLWSVYQLFRLATGKEGMGYGDFKLFAALGAWLGWKMLIPIILIAAAVGAVCGIVLLAVRGKDRGTPLAFGPYLAASGWVILMFGPELVSGYLGMFAPR